jgi:hypothetical protein
MDILLTWVGARDPTWLNPRTRRTEPGPILSLLRYRHCDAVFLLLNPLARADDFASRATGVMRACQRHFPDVRVVQKPVDLISVTDYEEVYQVTNDACQRILAEEGTHDRRYFVYLSPGTPQMQTVWILLVQSGLLPAQMLMTTPPDLVAPGVSPVREVTLSLPRLPQIVSPDEIERRVGILEVQNRNLIAENLRLQAELDLLRGGTPDAFENGIPADFRLRDHLMAQERAMFVQALEQANGNAAEAARLLGIEPAAFRARASTLGVRARRGR